MKEMSLKSDNVEFVRYCGGHFENGDRQKFFDVGNQFNFRTLKSNNVEFVRYCGSHFENGDRQTFFDVRPTYEMSLKSDNVEFLRIVVAILKMANSRNFSMSGINSGHQYLPTYTILMISDNVEFLPSIFYAVFWQPF